MKLTASDKFISLARGASKVLQWRIFIKTTAILTDALTVGDWVEVTHLVDAVPDIMQKIEYEVGQFTSDRITIKAKDVLYWHDTVFRDGVTTNPQQYVECKVELRLGDGTAYASDIIYMFAGYVDFINILFDEIKNEVQFSVYTAEDLMGTIVAENISTQYIYGNIGGAGNVSGLVMQKIPGLYCRNANIANLPLQSGVHIITYQVNGGLNQAKLDNGIFKTLMYGDNDLGNVDNGAGDTQRVRMYVKDLANLPPSITAITDSLIVLLSPTTLPRQWFSTVSLKYLLNRIYSRVGINTVSYDSMFFNSYDNSRRMSYLDNPPSDPTIAGPKGAMATNGTDIFIGIGNVVYKRSMTTELYTVVTTVGASYVIHKLFYNARKNFLWVLYGLAAMGGEFSGADNITMTVRLVNLSGVDVFGDSAATTMGLDAYDLIDYNYTGSSYHMSILYPDPTISTVFKEVKWDGTDFPPGLSIVSTGTVSAFPRHVYQRANVFKFTNSASVDSYRLMTIDAADAWILGLVETGPATVARGSAFNSVDSRIYRLMADGSLNWHVENSASVTGVSGITAGVNNYWALGFASDGRLIGYAQDTTDLKWGLFTVTSSVLTWLAKDVSLQPSQLPQLPHPSSTVLIGSKYLGLGNGGGLFQFHTSISLYVDQGDFTGMTVRDALNAILRAGNLIATVAATKKAYVYKRGDLSGTPQTTGNILTLNISDVSQIEEILGAYQKYGFISISARSQTVTYDGYSFNVPTLVNTASLNIDNKYIPDLIVKDMVVYTFNFFKQTRRLMKISMPLVPLFQYEVFDAVNINFVSPLRLQRVVTGINNPIYSITYRSDGTMNIEFVVTQQEGLLEMWMPRGDVVMRKKRGQLLPASTATPTATRAV